MVLLSNHGSHVSFYLNPSLVSVIRCYVGGRSIVNTGGKLLSLNESCYSIVASWCGEQVE